MRSMVVVEVSPRDVGKVLRAVLVVLIGLAVVYAVCGPVVAVLAAVSVLALVGLVIWLLRRWTR